MLEMQTVETTLADVRGFCEEGCVPLQVGSSDLDMMLCSSPAGRRIAGKICAGVKAGLHNFHGEVKMGITCKICPPGNCGGRH